MAWNSCSAWKDKKVLAAVCAIKMGLWRKHFWARVEGTPSLTEPWLDVAKAVRVQRKKDNAQEEGEDRPWHDRIDVAPDIL